MNFDAKTYEIIENYLTGNLDDNLRSDFEKRMLEDQSLADEVALHKKLYEQAAIQNVLESEEAMVFQQKLNTAQNAHNNKIIPLNSAPEKAENSKRIKWMSFAAAAAIALLIGFYMPNLFKGQDKTDNSPMALYQNYAKHETLALVSKSADANNFAEIESAFKIRNYERTSSLISAALEGLPQSHPQWFSLKLTQGICHLELDEFNIAEEAFLRLKNTDHPDTPKADWYLVLTFLKQNNKEMTRQLIDKALAAGHGYRASAMKEIRAAL